MKPHDQLGHTATLSGSGTVGRVIWPRVRRALQQWCWERDWHLETDIDMGWTKGVFRIKIHLPAAEGHEAKQLLDT